MLPLWPRGKTQYYVLDDFFKNSGTDYPYYGHRYEIKDLFTHGRSHFPDEELEVFHRGRDTGVMWCRERTSNLLVAFEDPNGLTCGIDASTGDPACGELGNEGDCCQLVNGECNGMAT
jgi:hypothetical protein